MTTQLLIYETAMPVSSGRHGRSSVDSSGGYAFSRHVNAVPLLAVEFPSAASEYAIVFAGEGDALMPAVVLGMRGKENAYLDPANGWRAKYVLAFIRRYPFVFSKSDDGKTFTLCIDEPLPALIGKAAVRPCSPQMASSHLMWRMCSSSCRTIKPSSSVPRPSAKSL